MRLDEFAAATMEAVGLSTEKIERRRFMGKRLPPAINRFARSADPERRDSGRVKTMDEELILTFRRSRPEQPTEKYGSTRSR